MLQEDVYKALNSSKSLEDFCSNSFNNILLTAGCIYFNLVKSIPSAYNYIKTLNGGSATIEQAKFSNFIDAGAIFSLAEVIGIY